MPDLRGEGAGIAEPVLDALVSEARKYLQNDPVVEKMHDVISVQRIDLGNPVRALDALIVVNQLIAALGDPNA